MNGTMVRIIVVVVAVAVVVVVVLTPYANTLIVLGNVVAGIGGQ